MKALGLLRLDVPEGHLIRLRVRVRVKALGLLRLDVADGHLIN